MPTRTRTAIVCAAAAARRFTGQNRATAVAPRRARPGHAASAPAACRPRSEQHVPALDVGHDIGMAERGHNLLERRHRDPLAAEVVDPPQQRNVSRHASIMSSRGRVPRLRSRRSTRSVPGRPIGKPVR